MTNLWHPFSQMARVAASGPLVIDRGERIYVWDEGGNRYLDAIAALWFCNVGYGRDEIADAVARQMRRLPAYHTFTGVANRPALDLAERLAAIAPVAESKVFFTSGGSDSVDTAAKLARRYWHQVGRPGKTVIISRERAYHGMHAYGTSIGGIDGNKDDYGEMIAGTTTVPWDSADALAAAIGDIGPERVAAFFCEPVIGAGGVLPPPLGYLKVVREICRDAGVLFIADEVVTGFGRVGDWFASNRFGLEPDILTFAKGVTSGYLPLGGLLIAPHLAQPFFEDPEVMWRHGYTYSGHAAACAAAIANLDILEREDLPGRTLGLEDDLEEALTPLLDHRLVTEVRAGVGMLAAVQLDPAAVTEDPTLPGRAAAAAMDAGILTRIVAGYAYQISPALVIDRHEMVELAAGLRRALDTL